MKNKIFAIILTLAMICTLLPVTASAAGKSLLREVHATVEEPVPGQKASYTADVPGGAHYTAVVDHWYKGEIWNRENRIAKDAVLEAGETYWVVIHFNPDPGYEVSETTKAFINEKPGKILNYLWDSGEISGKSYVSGVSLKCAHELYDIKATVTEPVPGRKPDYDTATVPADAHYTAEVFNWYHGETWDPNSGINKNTVFVEGETYWVSVRYVPDREHKMSELTDAFINEKYGQALNYVWSDGSYMSAVPFKCQVKKDPIPIKKVDVTVDLPGIGEKVNETRTHVPKDANYKVSLPATWFVGETEDNLTQINQMSKVAVFEKGKTYWPLVCIEPALGYEFGDPGMADYISMTINGIKVENPYIQLDGTLSGRVPLKPVTYINEVSVTITEPVAGRDPYRAVVTVPGDANYSQVYRSLFWLEGESWLYSDDLIEPGHVFEEGKTYWPYIYLQPHEGYAFRNDGPQPDGITMTINGIKVTSEDPFGVGADGHLCGAVALKARAADPLPFTDVPKDQWYYPYVEKVYGRELMNGHTPSIFGPEENLSRAQLAQILYNKERNPDVLAHTPFTDVEQTAWYSFAVIWANNKGYVGGYGGGLFGPEDPITREQLATILWRYAGKPETTGSLDAFRDQGKTDNWAETALRWAVEKKIMGGKGDGILDPLGNATRAEVAKMIMCYIENVEL